MDRSKSKKPSTDGAIKDASESKLEPSVLFVCDGSTPDHGDAFGGQLDYYLYATLVNSYLWLVDKVEYLQ